MEAIYRQFGRLLRRARQTAGLTQQELAKRVGLSRTSITNIEQGNQHVGLDLLYRFSEALHVPPRRLLPEEREGDPYVDRVFQGIHRTQRDKLRREMSRLSEADQARIIRLIGEAHQDAQG